MLSCKRYVTVNHSLSAFEIAEETERRFFTWQNVIFDLIWSVPKPTVKSTLCGREHLPICRQQICVQSPKLVCMQLSKSPVCSAEGNHEINIDETATVKRSVWFWSLLPGLMAPCRSDFLWVRERETGILLSLGLAWAFSMGWMWLIHRWSVTGESKASVCDQQHNFILSLHWNAFDHLRSLHEHASWRYLHNKTATLNKKLKIQFKWMRLCMEFELF